MTDDEARAVPARDITDREDAAIAGLAVAALNEAKTGLDAAEMLVGAATLILLRYHGPKATVDVLERLAAVQRQTLKDHLQ